MTQKGYQPTNVPRNTITLHNNGNTVQDFSITCVTCVIIAFIVYHWHILPKAIKCFDIVQNVKTNMAHLTSRIFHISLSIKICLCYSTALSSLFLLFCYLLFPMTNSFLSLSGSQCGFKNRLVKSLYRISQWIYRLIELIFVQLPVLLVLLKQRLR